jgi:tetratricopeptide (TPR) repeat protein
MDIQTTLRELDAIFKSGEHHRIEPFLVEHLRQAEAEGDKPSMLSLQNELMGYYRALSRFREALELGEKALSLLESMGYKGSVPYATTLLNVATAYRAEGQVDKAIGMYEEVMQIYTANKLEDVYLTASLYNNLSLAYQEAGQHEKAIELLDRAMPLVRSLPESAVHVATTHTNRGISEIRCGRFAAAREDLQAALAIYETGHTGSSHYAGALAGMGEVAFREKQPQESIGFYERALQEIAGHYGKQNLYYAVTLDSLAVVYEDLDKPKSEALAAEAQQIRDAVKQA